MPAKLTVVCTDVMEWARQYEGKPFHCILADPPYHLTSGHGASAGFMNVTWDGEAGGVGIAFQPETWAALAEHLLPGAWIMAFASSRRWHRMACAIEDAGMVIQPSIFGWATSQSFPKSTKIDTQVDRAAGAERGIVGKHPSPSSTNPRLAMGGGWQEMPDITAPATSLARTWQGHRYGGQVLKDSLTPIICAQKPWGKCRLDDIVETGAGSLWIEGGRIIATTNDPNDRDVFSHCEQATSWGNPNAMAKQTGCYSQGRWPSNLALCHSAPHLCVNCSGDGCDTCGSAGLVGGCRRVGTRRVKGIRGGNSNAGSGLFEFGHDSKRIGKPCGYADANGLETVSAYTCAIRCTTCGHEWLAVDRERCPECEGESEWVCAVRRLGEQSGVTSERARVLHHQSASGFVDDGQGHETVTHAGQGTCARFFLNADWSFEIAERLATTDPIRYQAKAGRRERDIGLEAMPLTTAPNPNYGKGGFNRPTNEPERKVSPARNNHPCCKPISLCLWLAKLLLPPPEYAPRRILIPFAGVMSEAISAMLAGFEEIVAIEQSAEYCKIGEARIKFWSQFNSYEEAMEAARNIQRGQRKRESTVENGQLELW